MQTSGADERSQGRPQPGQLDNDFRRPSRGDIDITQTVAMPPMNQIPVVRTNEAKAAAGRDALLARWRGHLAASKTS